MSPYPISFFAKAKSASGMQTPWATESAGNQLQCTIPVEFDGPGGGLSPEDLFAQALTNCFLATFKVYAEKSKVLFTGVDVHTELIVDYDEEKKPVMKKAILKVEIQGANSEDRAKNLAQRAFKSGFILNSVKTEVQLDLKLTPGQSL